MGSQWENGLFECDSVGLCMGAWCCPCFLFGRTKERLNHFPQDNPGEQVNTDCLIFCATLWVGVPCIPTFLRRTEMRSRFGIEGDTAKDFLISCCCNCCALAQMEGEVKKRAVREVGAGANAGYARPDDKMAYQAPSGQQQPV